MITFEGDPLQSASIEFLINLDNDPQTGISHGQFLGIDYHWWFENGENGFMTFGPIGNHEVKDVPGVEVEVVQGGIWRVTWPEEDLQMPPLPGQSYLNGHTFAINFVPVQSSHLKVNSTTMVIGLVVWDYGENGLNMVLDEVAPVEFTFPAMGE